MIWPGYCRRLLYGALALMPLWYTAGQPADFVFHHLRVQDGLSQATNAFIYKDSRGFVWISSISGLNRFDGTQVKVYTPDRTDPSSLLGENIQSQFFEDDEGDIWFCTYEAIHRYDYSHDCFDVFQLEDSLGHSPVGYYAFFLDAAQNLWFAVGGSALYTFHLPSGTFSKRGWVPLNTQRCFVHCDSRGMPDRIYTRGTIEPGVQVIDVLHDQCTPATPLALDPVLNVHGGVKVIPQGDDTLWILTPDFLALHKLSSETTTLYPIQGTKDMVEYGDSLLLISTIAQGLLFFNKHTLRIDRQLTRQSKSRTGLLSNSVTYLYVDRDHVIWASSVGEGISYTDPGKGKFRTEYIPAPDGLDQEVIPRALEQVRPGTLLCFSRSSGVLEIDHSTDQVMFRPVRQNGAPCPKEIHLAQRYAGEPFWIASWEGLYRYEVETAKFIQITNDSLVAYSLYPIQGNRAYFTGSHESAYTISMREGPTYAFSQVRGFISPGEYFPIWEDHQKRLWSFNQMQQLEIVDSTHNVLLVTLPISGFFHRLALSPDSSVVWMAGSSGLWKMDAASLTLLKQYDSRNGMPAGGLSDMLIEPTGVIWLSHANGILRFDPDTEAIQYYDADDGLPALEFMQAAVQLANGEMWFGAVGSVTHFFPEDIRPLTTAAIPQITELLIDDRRPEQSLRCMMTGATHVPAMQKLRLSYRDNTLAFVLNALEYSAPAKNRIRYRMVGLDETFIDVANGHQVRYPDMPPGDYQLVVYASNSDGVEHPVPRILELTILPPFYKTWWFYTLVALTAISIIAYIVYLRFSKALELQKVRLRLYENLHDDVGARLTAIALSAEELERSENFQNSKLTQIKNIARSIVGNMKRLVWAIDPENDRMNSIIQKINHDQSQILRDDIDFRLEVDPGLKQMVVPGEVRYQISSICSEAFNNIAKYAEATEVRVKFTSDNGKIRLLITDNGRGFDPADKVKDRSSGSGYGLGNMQKRADRVKGTFEIRSKPGEGTQIIFTFPFR